MPWWSVQKVAKLIHDVDCGSLVMVIFIDRVCNSLSTGIGPSTLCFFQQSAKILALIMYLMITSSCRTYSAKRATSSTDNTYPHWLSFWPLQLCPHDQPVSSLTGLFQDNVIINPTSAHPACLLLCRSSAFARHTCAGCDTESRIKPWV